MAADPATRTSGPYRERLSTRFAVFVPSTAPSCVEEKISRIVCTGDSKERIGVAQCVLYGTYTRHLFKL